MKPEDEGTNMSSKNQNENSGAEGPPTDMDKLNYIEDLALELKELAAQGGYETLSGIFEMASREARLRKAG